jgi:protein-L-isoaspartate(D-aspartate) O-methyltransferase
VMFANRCDLWCRTKTIGSLKLGGTWSSIISVAGTLRTSACWRRWVAFPRHLYVPDDLQNSAYADRPLPIGRGQTISQPYIVALMTQLARPLADSRALDVGTGSGYQAAVLGELCKEVYSIEIVESLADQAAERLARQGYENVRVRAGDGYQGWPEHAPFDLIIVAAAPDHVPEPLVEQLAPGGRLIIPVGRFQQDLMVIEKQDDGTVLRWSEIPVAFVPMTGEAQQPKQQRE